ncbi:MAG: helix-turn-helix domain-containing protein [Gemmataceae bacterium]
MSVSRNKLTPPQLAERWGISPDKILGWIRRKELRAINAAATMGGRPRYLIDLDDILAFERRREVDALPRQNRRPRKHDKSTTNYF